MQNYEAKIEKKAEHQRSKSNIGSIYPNVFAELKGGGWEVQELNCDFHKLVLVGKKNRVRRYQEVALGIFPFSILVSWQYLESRINVTAYWLSNFDLLVLLANLTEANKFLSKGRTSFKNKINQEKKHTIKVHSQGIQIVRAQET